MTSPNPWFVLGDLPNPRFVLGDLPNPWYVVGNLPNPWFILGFPDHWFLKVSPPWCLIFLWISSPILDLAPFLLIDITIFAINVLKQTHSQTPQFEKEIDVRPDVRHLQSFLKQSHDLFDFGCVGHCQTTIHGHSSCSYSHSYLHPQVEHSYCRFWNLLIITIFHCVPNYSKLGSISHM